MRDQDWDLSWKLGNTAGNGGVVSGGPCTRCGTGGIFVFRPHLSRLHKFVAHQSCLIGNFPYVQKGGSMAKTLQVED